MAQIFWVMATFSSAMDRGWFSYTWSFKNVGYICVWGAMAVIWNMCSNKYILWVELRSSVFELETSNLQFFHCYHISFQEMYIVGEFLVWVINYYHVNGFQLYWDTLYIWPRKAQFTAAGKAWKAMMWPTPGLKEGTLCSLGSKLLNILLSFVIGWQV